MPTTVRACRRLRAPAHCRKLASGHRRSNVGTGPRRSARLRRSTACRSLPRRRCASGVTVARYYDPATAQFLTRDPLEAQTRSPYGYVNNDPLNASDPSGLDCGWTSPWDCADNVAKVAEVAAVVAVVATVAVVAAPILLPAGAITAGLTLYAADVATVAIYTATVADSYVAVGTCADNFNSGNCSRAVASAAFDYASLGIVKGLAATPFPGRVAARGAELLANKANAGLAIGALGLSRLYALANDCGGEDS